MENPAEPSPVSAGSPQVLIIDDDTGLLRLMDKALRREGLRTATVSSGWEAAIWLEEQQADLLLMDLKLQDMPGSDLIQELGRTRPCPPFIIVTGQGDERVAVEMMKRGAMDYLVKDTEFLQLLPTVVRRALERLDQARRLAEAEAQLHLIRSAIDQGYSAVAITSADLPDPRVLYINPAFAQATGYTPELVVGRPLSTLANLTSVLRRLRLGMAEGETFSEEVSTFQTPEGERWGEWRVGPVHDKLGRNTHWLIIFRDITERKRLEKELLEISDRERQRLGQDLHDGLCQYLAGIELMSQVLEQQLAVKSRKSAAAVGDIGRHVREAIGQTRALARGLCPVTLELEGLGSALRELAANAEKIFGVSCRYVSDQPAAMPERSVATHLYRIAQEAVSNAIKHGKASEILIRLEPFGERLVLSVTDDGEGLPEAGLKSRGMGLRIMHYRASMISANLSLQNHSGGGASLVCSVPLTG
jgi:PAS domain S-box-containing protein